MGQGLTARMLDAESRRRLRRVSWWRSALALLLVDATAILATWAGGVASGWRLAPVAFVVVAVCQVHLSMLLHDGAHFLLHPNRRVNDALADVLAAIPTMNSVRRYRHFHMVHHRHTGDPAGDPEHAIYRGMGYEFERASARALLRSAIRDWTLIHLRAFVGGMDAFARSEEQSGRLAPPSVGERALSAAVWLAIAGAAIATGTWIEALVFWIGPQLTLSFVLLKLHGQGEHTGAPGPTEFERTWNRDLPWYERWIICPLGSGFHLDHHLFPQVPWYNLRALHRQLLRSDEYRARHGDATVDSYLFGRRSVLRGQLLGEGSRRDEIAARRREQRDVAFGPTAQGGWVE